MAKKVKRMTVEEVEAGQRDWQRKWESGEFAKEANAARDRICRAAPDLLAACKSALHRMTQDGYEPHHHGGETLVKLRAAIAKAEAK